MAKRSKVHPNYKTRDPVTNWPSYDRGLVQRGSLTVWFAPEAINVGIRMSRSRSLVELVGLDLDVPDHTTLSRRSRDLATDLPRAPSSGPIHLIVDASGLKVLGQGEWAAAKYGGRRMGWRKLHLPVDER